MSTTQKTSNKATVTRFCDAVNTGDAELIARTIDEIVEPDAVIRTPSPRGRIAETWGIVDVFSQMQELGVIPTALATSELRPSSS